MRSREVIWEVTAAQWDALDEYAGMLANATISQHDYLDRLRSLGMPAAGPGAHVRIVLRTRASSTVLPARSAAALRGGHLPGLPH